MIYINYSEIQEEKIKENRTIYPGMTNNSFDRKKKTNKYNDWKISKISFRLLINEGKIRGNVSVKYNYYYTYMILLKNHRIWGRKYKIWRN